MHDGGWWSFIRYDEKQDRPQVSWALIRRVAGVRPALRRQDRADAGAHPRDHAVEPDPAAAHARPDRLRAPAGKRGAAEPAGAGHDRHPAGHRAARRGPALPQRDRRRGGDLRPAGGALRPSAAHVAALLHQHQDGRADVAAEQRRRRRAAGGHRHHRRPGDQRRHAGQRAGDHAAPRVAADAAGRGGAAALPDPGALSWAGACAASCASR